MARERLYELSRAVAYLLDSNWRGLLFLYNMVAG